MDDVLKQDLQAVADKDLQKFSVTIEVPPVTPTMETVTFTPVIPSSI